MSRAAALPWLFLAVSVPLQAEVRQSDAAGFVVEHKFAIAATPSASWRALGKPDRWWPAEHTWSGSARNLSLSLDAPGCFCERWKGGSAVHGDVIHARSNELLRIQGAFGPMQDMAVVGIVSVALAAADEGTAATVTYRVSGTAAHALDKLAPIVDKVIGEQFGRYAAFASGTLAAARDD
jgi:uncharacterized protein YndB with AHSA1/START domain